MTSKIDRRTFIKTSAGAGALAATSGGLAAPAIAQGAKVTVGLGYAHRPQWSAPVAAFGQFFCQALQLDVQPAAKLKAVLEITKSLAGT